MVRRLCWALATVALLVTVASAQTVDEIVAKHVAARGGAEKLATIRTMRQTGKLVLPSGLELPLRIYSKRPLRSRIEFQFDGKTAVQACDGARAWSSMPPMGKPDPEPMSRAQTVDMLAQADFDGPLVDWRSKGTRIALVGRESVDGVDAFKLEVTPKRGAPRFVFVDAERYLEIKVETRVVTKGHTAVGETFLRDYRDEGGVMMAHTIENGTRGSAARQKLVFETIETNLDVPDSLFVMPRVERKKK